MDQSGRSGGGFPAGPVATSRVHDAILRGTFDLVNPFNDQLVRRSTLGGSTAELPDVGTSSR
jgi:hypothetical protein